MVTDSPDYEKRRKLEKMVVDLKHYPIERSI